MPVAATQGLPSTTGIEILLARGDIMAARRELDALADAVGSHARQAHDVAQLYMRLKDPARAVAFYDRAVMLEPGQPAYRYNQSTALIALGRFEQAEAALDDVIAVRPQDWDAWYNRATLRQQTPEHNHVEALEKELARPGLPPAAIPPLNYALAKELEDLGQFDRSFVALARGAAARRSMLAYRVEDDEAIMRDIRATFTRGVIDAAPYGCHDRRPVFVVGLPRSGTTLVDRILSSHSRVDSHGESTDFAVSLMQLAGKCKDKTELLERSVQVDPRQLGLAYGRRLADYSKDRVVDKTPANFLYLGLIVRALPDARIVYVRREPMDVCYAIYKTLFRMAYPYSYDLGDLGRYWIAFDALMRHWQEVLPAGRMTVIDYERLVETPEAVMRALLKHLGLPWEDACLHFEKNPAPSLTASAAQVRQPIYRSSVGSWQSHRVGLAPLAKLLSEASVAVHAEKPE